MSMLAAIMGGGALPPLADLIHLPCAICLLDVADGIQRGPAHDGVTLAGGTVVCGPHVARVLPGVRL